MSEPDVLIVVPCYNEQFRLPAPQFRDFVEAETGFRFLFVNDGSTDDTAQVLDALRGDCPQRFDLLQLDRNQGKAEAIRRGFVHGFGTGADFLGFWDADLSTPLDALPRFVRVFVEHPDSQMVFGSRVKLMGRDIERRLLRHYLGRCFATVASIVVRLPIYDTQCGAKLFRVTDTLPQLFEAPFRSKWIFDVELIARFVRQQEPRPRSEMQRLIYELPLHVWHDVSGSKLKARDYLVAMIEMARIYMTYR